MNPAPTPEIGECYSHLGTPPHIKCIYKDINKDRVIEGTEGSLIEYGGGGSLIEYGGGGSLIHVL